MERLSDYTERMKNWQSKIQAGRYLQCKALARGDSVAASEIARAHKEWAGNEALSRALLASVDPHVEGDFAGALRPLSEAFLSAMRPNSIPRQLVGLRRVPSRTRLYIDVDGVVISEVLESGAVPVLAGNWTQVTLAPRKFGGTLVRTDELVMSASATAAAAFIDDLSAATSEQENFSFYNPDTPDSALFGKPNFIGAGPSLAQVDGDLKTLVDLVPGAHKDGVFVMDQSTATALSLLRGTGGGAAFPLVGPAGGTLLHLPVLITAAAELPGSPPTRTIGLLSPSRIFFGEDGNVELSTSKNAALKMDNAATSAPGNVVSMFQTNSTALQAILRSSWYAAEGSGAYFTTGF